MRPRPWRDHLPPGSSIDTPDLTARGSLPTAWAGVWGAHADRPLLYDAGAGPDARWVSAARFEEQTRRAAARFAELGLEAGDRVVWSMGSSLAAAVVNIGALRAGLVVVPANRLYTERELGHIVADVRPAAAVVDDPPRARWIEDASASAVPVLGPDLQVLRGVVPVDAARAAAVDAAPGDAPALIAYTSGTTGAPKGAVLTHANVLANSESVSLTWRWQPEDRLVHALPIFHGHGLCVALYTSLLVGASVVLLPSFDVDGVLDASDAHGATLFFGVPTMYHRIAASGRARELSRLRLAVSGSAPLAAELHGALERDAGTRVLERYGMTETLMTLSNPYDGERRAGTVGFPFPGVDAWIGEEPPPDAAVAREPAGTGVDAGTDAGTDAAEILVRGPTVFAGYWERPAASAERFAGSGWLRTGDMGSVDADGYVAIRGRRTDMVISGGYNVYPAEVEDALLAHPAVREVAVTGTPSDEWGEVVTAWVVADGPAPPAGDLLAFAAARLAPYKRPRQVHFVDALPRNAMGKVVRGALG
ncbi:MAG TPA: AMP-binding protein [Acidimicrobiales bacterium]|nr:AMP-binding protein [Acidimicrobiales bacterium]